MLSRCALNSTGMLAVHLNSTTVAELIASSDFSSLTVACYGTPTDCIVSGPLEHLRSLEAILETQALSMLHLVITVLPWNLSSMNSMTFAVRFPSIPMIPVRVASNVHGWLILPQYSIQSSLLSLRTTSSIRGGPLAFNVPHWCGTSIRRQFRREPSASVDLYKQHDDWMTLMSSLAQLFLSTTEVRWRNVFSTCVALMCNTYPFAKSKFWIPYTGDNRPVLDLVVPKALPTYSMLRSWTQYLNAENAFMAIFQTPISQLSRWIPLAGERYVLLPFISSKFSLQFSFWGAILPWLLNARHWILETSRPSCLIRYHRFRTANTYLLYSRMLLESAKQQTIVSGHRPSWCERASWQMVLVRSKYSLAAATEEKRLTISTQ